MKKPSSARDREGFVDETQGFEVIIVECEVDDGVEKFKRETHCR